MTDDADQTIVRPLSSGLNQSGLRDYNERLLLSMLQRNGAMPGSDLARRAGVSPQTVSVIMRKLETDGLLRRGTPTRGKVGKPSIPMALNPDGVLSLGLKIGRRSADLVLMDFQGGIRVQLQTTYRYPMPTEVFSFLESGVQTVIGSLNEETLRRVCGIGIAAPFEIWNWHELVGAPREEFLTWKDVDFATEVSRFSDLPVFITNDATAACKAEHVFGRGREFRDYAYFFVGAFIGGGIVLNDSVYEGHQGNAGAMGALRSIDRNGKSRQLLDTASIYLLEAELAKANLDPRQLWTQPQDWSGISEFVDSWVDQAALGLAIASVSTCAVIDFEAILIDGAIPDGVKTALVAKIRNHIKRQDTRGLIQPRIETGIIGRNARAIGAACGPIFSQYLLNTNASLSAG